MSKKDLLKGAYTRAVCTERALAELNKMRQAACDEFTKYLDEVHRLAGGIMPGDIIRRGDKTYRVRAVSPFFSCGFMGGEAPLPGASLFTRRYVNSKARATLCTVRGDGRVNATGKVCSPLGEGVEVLARVGKEADEYLKSLVKKRKGNG